MLQSFTGEFTQQVDGKGRMSVPASFRRVLEANDPDWTEGLPVRLYLNYGAHLKQNLRIYSVRALSRIADRIASLPEGSELQIRLNRLYLGQSEELTVDKDGRLVMPAKRREKLGLVEGETTLMGLGSYFEVWKSETYEATVADDTEDWLAENAAGVDPLSLIPPAPPGAA